MKRNSDLGRRTFLRLTGAAAAAGFGGILESRRAPPGLRSLTLRLSDSGPVR
jgi:hypothetical protein